MTRRYYTDENGKQQWIDAEGQAFIHWMESYEHCAEVYAKHGVTGLRLVDWHILAQARRHMTVTGGSAVNRGLWIALRHLPTLPHEWRY